MAEVFLSRNDIIMAWLIIGSGQCKIIMLAVPINYYQTTALSKMSESSSSQGVNDLGQFRFGALFRGDKNKYPVSSINMSAPKTNALCLFRHSLSHVVKSPSQFGALAQPHVNEYLLQQNVVLTLPIRVKQRARIRAYSLSIVWVSDGQTIRHMFKETAEKTVFRVAFLRLSC